MIDSAIAENGYAPSVRQNLSVTFKKATLSINAEEARGGAYHQLADGQPFYRMEIAASGKTIFDADKDQSAALAFYLMQVLGGGSVSIGGPLVIEHDFRGDLLQMGLELAAVIERLKPHVVKDVPAKPAGPKLN